MCARSQPDMDTSPRHDIAPPHARHTGAASVEIRDVEEGILIGSALRLVIVAVPESYPHHRNPVRRFVWRATPSALHALDLSDGKHWNGRGGDAHTIATQDRHRRDDPLTDHDAARA